jgi:hypothetical protein
VIAGDTQSMAAVRQPLNNSPVTDVESADVTCNVSPSAATETVEVAAGSTLGFILDNTLYHQGPAAIYLGQVPSGSTAADWDGSGAAWFKVYSSITYSIIPSDMELRLPSGERHSILSLSPTST